MARRKKKAPPPPVAAAPPEEATAPAPSKYRYVGPPGVEVSLSQIAVTFRPATITDARITALLQRYPLLSRYFVAAAGEEE